ncbi:MAG: hypothetical protein ACMG6S_02040 [Byssovorax sp.]
MKHVWILPAVASVAFFSFTVSVMLAEGPFGFVTEHTRNGWGNQIGIDLFTSATLALCFAAPLARRHGVRLWPWILLTIATGSIGLLALQARILYARSRGRSRADDQVTHLAPQALTDRRIASS